MKIETRYGQEPIFKENKDKSFTVLKNIELAINTFIPKKFVKMYINDVLEIEPTKEFFVVFIIKRFDVFLSFACKILKIMQKSGLKRNKMSG